jgi:hypothetical protein
MRRPRHPSAGPQRLGTRRVGYHTTSSSALEVQGEVDLARAAVDYVAVEALESKKEVVEEAPVVEVTEVVGTARVAMERVVEEERARVKVAAEEAEESGPCGLWQR